jgi:hypothetical protein
MWMRVVFLLLVRCNMMQPGRICTRPAAAGKDFPRAQQACERSFEPFGCNESLPSKSRQWEFMTAWFICTEDLQVQPVQLITAGSWGMWLAFHFERCPSIVKSVCVNSRKQISVQAGATTSQDQQTTFEYPSFESLEFWNQNWSRLRIEKRWFHA